MQTVPAPRSPNRWIVLAALYVGYASFGMVAAGIAPLITPIRAELGLSQSAMGLILGTWTMVYIGAAIPAGALLDRIGTRLGIGLGLALIVVSALARAFAVDFTTLFLAVALFGVGGPMISIGSPKLISQLFDDEERPTAVGIYLTAPGVGAVIALGTANSVLMPLYADSWRLTLGTYAAFAGLTVAIWMLVARDSGRAQAAGKQAPGWGAFAELRSVRVVQVLLAMGFLSFFFNHAINNWLPEVLRARGFGAAEAGFWSTIPVLVSIPGSVLITRMATGARRIAVLQAGFALLCVTPFLLAFTEGAALVLGLVLLSIGRILAAVIMLVLMEAPGVGARNMGAAGGLYFTTGEIGGVLGPTLMGVMADLTGGFAGALMMLAAFAGMLCALTFALGSAQARAAAGDLKRGQAGA